MYALLARMYGNNNLPDSVPTCATRAPPWPSAAEHRRAGRHHGPVRISRRPTSSCSSARTSAPTRPACCIRCRRRASAECRSSPSTRCASGGLERFTNPQSPAEMLTRRSTEISTQYHQVKAGGDIAALAGICKALLAADRAARGPGRLAHPRPRVHRPAYAWARCGIRGLLRRAGLAGARIPLGPEARGDGGGGGRLCAGPRRHRHLRHGPDAAPQGRRDRADAGQPAAAARQHRQSRGRHLPRARPFQRPGAAHGRHLGKARTRAARHAGGALRVRAAARQGAQHRRGLRRACWRARSRPSSASAAISSAPSRTRRAWSRPGAGCA